MDIPVGWNDETGICNSCAQSEVLELREQLTHERQLRLAGEVAMKVKDEALRFIRSSMQGDPHYLKDTIEATTAINYTPPTNTLANVVEANQSDCIRRIHGYVLDRLEEVTNEIGGVIGYKLNLSAEETEGLWRDIESGVKEPSLNPPAHESSMHADSEIKRFCDGPA